MRALISLIVSTIMLHLSVHAIKQKDLGETSMFPEEN